MTARVRNRFRRAAAVPDQQRDRIFDEFVESYGGYVGACDLVVQHMATHGFEIDEQEAARLLSQWRLFGVVRDESLGEYLDEVAASDGPP